MVHVLDEPGVTRTVARIAFETPRRHAQRFLRTVRRREVGGIVRSRPSVGVLDDVVRREVGDRDELRGVRPRRIGRGVDDQRVAVADPVLLALVEDRLRAVVVVQERGRRTEEAERRGVADRVEGAVADRRHGLRNRRAGDARVVAEKLAELGKRARGEVQVVGDARVADPAVALEVPGRVVEGNGIVASRRDEVRAERRRIEVLEVLAIRRVVVEDALRGAAVVLHEGRGVRGKLGRFEQRASGEAAALDVDDARTVEARHRHVLEHELRQGLEARRERHRPLHRREAGVVDRRERRASTEVPVAHHANHGGRNLDLRQRRAVAERALPPVDDGVRQIGLLQIRVAAVGDTELVRRDRDDLDARIGLDGCQVDDAVRAVLRVGDAVDLLAGVSDSVVSLVEVGQRDRPAAGVVDDLVGIARIDRPGHRPGRSGADGAEKKKGGETFHGCVPFVSRPATRRSWWRPDPRNGVSRTC